MPKLRPYQKNDVLKLAKLKCSACLNEQRTGKTPTSLVTLDTEGHKKILIIIKYTLIRQKTLIGIQQTCINTIERDNYEKDMGYEARKWTASDSSQSLGSLSDTSDSLAQLYGGDTSNRTNPTSVEEVKELYEKFLGKPNSHKAHELLHTHYSAKERFPEEKQFKKLH